MKKNNPVLRTCIVCRKKGDKHDFIRIVKDKNNSISIDKQEKKNGRGCYVCDNTECVEKLYKTRALNRAYKTNISEKIYDDILQAIRSDR